LNQDFLLLQEVTGSVKEYTDIEIIECLRNRQSYVVYYLSDRYLPMIRLLVTQLGGTTEDAKDIFQEGLMIMIEKIDNREFTLTCKFKTFLYCICENLWKVVLAKRQIAANYFRRRVEDDDDTDFAGLMDDKLCYGIFRKVFESLNPISKTILKLYWEERSPQEIADKLGYTNGYVRKKKCEAQAELIAKVKSDPDYQRIMNSEKVLRRIVH
jgi:RNA polymerase sigma factor (sigma-70 family)